MSDRAALCTLEVEAVPHQPFPDRMILAVEDAVRRAWSLLTENIPEDKLVAATEPDITNSLRNYLEELRCMKPRLAFNEAEFSQVVIGAEVENFNGKKLQKKPDLTFYCRDRRVGVRLSIYDAIFCEAKWVGNGRTVSSYASDGIARFVEGDYAWAMPHGLMVAYAQGEALPVSLGERLIGDALGRYQVVAPPVLKKSRAADDVYVSLHNRTWTHRNGSAPGPIHLRHLWLHVPSRAASIKTPVRKVD